MSNTEDRKEANIYELGYLILPSITEDKLSQVVSNLQGIIKKAGAKELDSEAPMKIDLAYTMSKTVGARKYVANDAYIGWVKFEGEPMSVPEIDKAVKSLDEILRHLLVKTTKETHFTFEEARKRQAELEKAREEAKKEAEEPKAEPVVE